MLFGPTPDGSFIRQMPVLELSTGNYWKGVESVILSHTADESSLFVSGAVQTDAQFSSLLDSVFPNYTRAEGVTAKVEAFYPPVSGGKNAKYPNQAARMAAFLRESCFTCNVRCKLALAVSIFLSFSLFPVLLLGTESVYAFYSGSRVTT